MTDQLHVNGFQFTQTAIGMTLLTADYGEGFQDATVIGSGLRTWAIKIAVLPGQSGFAPAVEDQTRADYLWDFFVEKKLAGDEPFWVFDFKDDVFHLASFVDHSLSFEMLCAKIYSTGLQLRQRRLAGVTAPIAGFPILDETGDAILDENGDEILEEPII